MRQHRWMVAALAMGLLFLALAVNGFPINSEVSAAPYGPAISASAGNGGRQAFGSEDEADSPPATVLDSQDAKSVLGSAVRSAADENMGHVVDVIVDRFGTTRAAVVDFGGFLGVGTRRIAIDWNAIKFGSHNRITVELTRDEVKAAPEYQAGKPVVVLGASKSFAQSHVTERMPER